MFHSLFLHLLKSLPYLGCVHSHLLARSTMYLLGSATCNGPASHVVASWAQVSGRIEYLVAPFWKQKYCRKHDDSNTPRCCSCNRLKASGQLWLMLSDQRMVCQDCSKTVVHDTQQAQPLYDEVSVIFTIQVCGSILAKDVFTVTLQRRCASRFWSDSCFLKAQPPCDNVTYIV